MSKIVHIVDDDEAIRDSIGTMLEGTGFACRAYGSARAFLDSRAAAQSACALVDVRMPEMDGLALLQELRKQGSELSVIIMTGFADVPLAVNAMKAGAIDFIEKPFLRKDLIAAIERGLARATAAPPGDSARLDARTRLGRLTEREREVLDLLVAGDANKMVAHKLGISPRTVEIHRGRVMEKTQAKSLAELVRLTLTARPGDT